MSGYGGAITGSLINFTMRLAVEGKNWDGDDYWKQGAVAIINAVTPILVAKNFGGVLGKSGQLSNAGVRTIHQLVANDNFDRKYAVSA